MKLIKKSFEFLHFQNELKIKFSLKTLKLEKNLLNYKKICEAEKILNTGDTKYLDQCTMAKIGSSASDLAPKVF